MGASIRESQIRLLTPDQKEMAECIGFEAYSKLAAYYGASGEKDNLYSLSVRIKSVGTYPG